MNFINAEQIEQHTDFTELVEVLRRAFRSDLVTPQRHHHQVENPDAGIESTLLLMPCWQPGERLGVKVVSVFPANSKYQLPSIHGIYILMDGKTGAVKCLLDGKALTAKRTAAASALASCFLSKKGSRSLLMIGTGAQAPDLIRAHAAVRPIEEVFVWGRNFEKAKRLVRDDIFLKNVISGQGKKMAVHAIERKEDVMGEVDIISCATLSESPLVFGEMLRPGQHLDLVGSFKINMREADDETILRSEIYVDTFGALDETGDLATPIANGILKPEDIRADLARLCRGEKPGRTSEESITLFKSVGHASEDLAAAEYFFHKISTRGGLERG
jgi:ornithine cyclodeaminase/alanine dehydrogenase-like protein (mu-crystallin family)